MSSSWDPYRDRIRRLFSNSCAVCAAPIDRIGLCAPCAEADAARRAGASYPKSTFSKPLSEFAADAYARDRLSGLPKYVRERLEAWMNDHDSHGREANLQSERLERLRGWSLRVTCPCGEKLVLQYADSDVVAGFAAVSAPLIDVESTAKTMSEYLAAATERMAQSLGDDVVVLERAAKRPAQKAPPVSAPDLRSRARPVRGDEV